MKNFKPSKNVTTFNRAIEMMKSPNQLNSSMLDPIKDKADDYIVYQNYRETIKNFAKFEDQKAEIIEFFRRKFF